MSYEDGWAALNLQMPSRVPRTEYSAESHWALLNTVTGIDVDENSPQERKQQARAAFTGPEGWNYDFFWSVLIGAGEFGDLRTTMGHAVYAAGGVDYNDDIHQLFEDPEDALAFDPVAALPHHDHATLVKRFEDHYRAQTEGGPTGVRMTGVYVTLVSGLIDLLGWETLLMAAGIDPVAFGKLADRYAEWMQRYFDALADADVPVVMVHDDIVWSEGAFIHPDWYRAHVFPNYRKYLRPLLDAGKKIVYTSDANYTQFIDDIVDCGVHAFVMEPMTDMQHIAEKYGKTHAFVGNADTRILLSGPRERIRAEVERCMAIGKECPGFFMAVGNHIPSNTPVENALYYNEAYEELSRR